MRALRIFDEFGEITQVKQDDGDLIDQQTMETNNFYRSWKESIERILLKAWDGQVKLTDEDIKTFKEIQRYKQGQELFIHLFNRFRNRNQKKIVNIQALF